MSNSLRFTIETFFIGLELALKKWCPVSGIMILIWQ